MATKHTDTCLQKAADDEPIFVLRGQDRLAPGIVREWAEAFRLERFNPLNNTWDSPDASAKYNEALELADKMAQWPDRKMPD